MRYIIGIDEVGRGCLAGPVVVAAFAVPLDFKIQPPKSKQISKLKDSKKLSSKQRDEWFKYIRSNPKMIFITRKVHPAVIDIINISNAANLAAYRAIESLSVKCQVSGVRCRIYLDGGLYIKNKGYQAEFFKNAKTVIKGDEKLKPAALASIVAKVSRDRYMRRLAKKYPQYGLEIHKGYGTKLHRKAIRRYGASDIHRKTFTHRLTR